MLLVGVLVGQPLFSCFLQKYDLHAPVQMFYTPKFFVCPSFSTSEFVQTEYTLRVEMKLNFIVCVQPFAVLIGILCGLLPVAPSHDALLVGVLFLVQSLFI